MEQEEYLSMPDPPGGSRLQEIRKKLGTEHEPDLDTIRTSVPRNDDPGPMIITAMCTCGDGSCAWSAAVYDMFQCGVDKVMRTWTAGKGSVEQ